MIMQLTRQGDGAKIEVNMKQVKFMEPRPEGGTFLVFSADLIRAVTETTDQIKSAVGAITLT